MPDRVLSSRMTLTPTSAELTLAGELDVASLRDAHAVSDAALELRDRLLVDLGGITFIDSAGLGWLIHLQRVLTERGGELTISAISAPVRRSLTLTGLDRLFTT